jgi:3-deoxy-manno-octulosonate cytidylyltransferase (CMP-KDO synthetase)
MTVAECNPSRIAIAIPARMESKRLPGKPLVEVGGKPLLWWAWQAASACKEASIKLVVTDSREIEQYCQQWHIPYYFSQQEHPTGTDRIAEAIFERRKDCPSYQKLTHVINLQCDEPDVMYEDLDRLAVAIRNDRKRSVYTFSADLNYGDTDNRNATKVVTDILDNAIYFSREPLAAGKLHVGVYGMSIDALKCFASVSQPAIEICERLEQLRFLYERFAIAVLPLGRTLRSINTPEDVEQWSAAIT